MAEKRPALGRGLSALIPPMHPPAPTPAPPAAAPPVEPSADPAEPTATAAATPPATRAPQEVDIDLLTPNPRQPRTDMDEQRLEELAQSIRANGVLQPVLVRRAGTRFEIVAGERRWRAAQRAGLLKVPVTVRDIPDDKLLEVALVENIQRENLNAIEEAQAYRRLSEDLHLSQEHIATAVGKDRATVANYMRLLRLPAEVRGEVAAGTLSMGHARALLTLPDEAAQRRVARDVVSRGLSVRETEALVKRATTPPVPPTPHVADPNTRAAEDQLKRALGARVRIARRGRGGRIEIDFASEDELQRLFEMIIGN
ncbi:MAG: ParB/RepB/Spo0J family partition protein [Vicinamibacterales bacterium]